MVKFWEIAYQNVNYQSLNNELCLVRPKRTNLI